MIMTYTVCGSFKNIPSFIFKFTMLRQALLFHLSHTEKRYEKVNRGTLSKFKSKSEAYRFKTRFP